MLLLHCFHLNCHTTTFHFRLLFWLHWWRNASPQFYKKKFSFKFTALLMTHTKPCPNGNCLATKHYQTCLVTKHVELSRQTVWNMFEQTWYGGIYGSKQKSKPRKAYTCKTCLTKLSKQTKHRLSSMRTKEMLHGVWSNVRLCYNAKWFKGHLNSIKVIKQHAFTCRSKSSPKPK